MLELKSRITDVFPAFQSDTLVSSDVTISDDESETDNILNKTMNEKVSKLSFLSH